MKFPIGIQSFERIIQEGYIYVDKTHIMEAFIFSAVRDVSERAYLFLLWKTIIQDVRNCFVVLP
jgi:hypothetical protein